MYYFIENTTVFKNDTKTNCWEQSQVKGTLNEYTSHIFDYLSQDQNLGAVTDVEWSVKGNMHIYNVNNTTDLIAFLN